jgi:hypothetical protein
MSTPSCGSPSSGRPSSSRRPTGWPSRRRGNVPRSAVPGQL